MKHHARIATIALGLTLASTLVTAQGGDHRPAEVLAVLLLHDHQR